MSFPQVTWKGGVWIAGAKENVGIYDGMIYGWNEFYGGINILQWLIIGFN